MRRFIGNVHRTMLPAALAVAFAVATAQSAHAGGALCACEELLKQLSPNEIPATLRVPDPDGEIIAAIDNGKRRITAIAFLEYGKIMAVAEGGPARKGEGPAGRVRLYDLSGKSPRPVGTLDVSGDYVSALATHPYEKDLLIAAGVRWDQRLQSRVLTGKTWQVISDLGKFSDWWIKDAAISPDRKTLATAAGGVRLWSLSGGELRHEETLRDGQAIVSAIAFSPDGKYLIAGTGTGKHRPDDGRLQVWSLGAKPPKLIAGADVAKGDVTAVVVLRSKRLISGDQQGNLQFWKFGGSVILKRTALVEAHHKGVRSLHPVIGDRLVSAGNDGTVALWKANTGRLLKRWTFKTTSAVATVAPSGRHVAVGLADGRVYLLRLAKK
jgi:WD40 repeat protein